MLSILPFVPLWSEMNILKEHILHTYLGEVCINYSADQSHCSELTLLKFFLEAIELNVYNKCLNLYLHSLFLKRVPI